MVEKLFYEVYSATAYWGDPDSVKGIDSDNSPVSVKWFDLQGREIHDRAHGVAVKVTECGDGSFIREKVILK